MHHLRFSVVAVHICFITRVLCHNTRYSDCWTGKYSIKALRELNFVHLSLKFFHFSWPCKWKWKEITSTPIRKIYFLFVSRTIQIKLTKNICRTIGTNKDHLANTDNNVALLAAFQIRYAGVSLPNVRISWCNCKRCIRNGLSCGRSRRTQCVRTESTTKGTGNLTSVKLSWIYSRYEWKIEW